MNVPKNVLWFEVLLYLSLTLDTLLAAFADRTPTAVKTEEMITADNVTARPASKRTVGDLPRCKKGEDQMSKYQRGV